MNLTPLEQLDPCRDWRPDAARAARLDLAVDRLVGEATAPLPLPRRSRRVPVLRLAAATAAVAAVGVVVGLPSGDGGPALTPVGARAALVQAVAHTTAFTSGHLTSTQTLTGESPAFRARVTNDARYEGGDTAIESTSLAEGKGVPGGRRSTTGGFRSVDGRTWFREGDGPWKRSDQPTSAETSRQDTLAGQLEIAGALADLARAAPTVTRVVGEGETTYRARVAAVDLPPPFSAPATSGSPVDLEVVVGDNGSVQQSRLTGPGFTATATFAELGAGQGITAP